VTSDGPLRDARARHQRFFGDPTTWVLVLLVLAVGSACTGIVAQRLRLSAEEEAQERFEQAAQQSTAQVADVLQAYIDRLRSVGAFVASRPSVTSEELRAYAARDNTFADLPSLQGLQFTQWVPEAQIDQFVREQQAADPGFTLKLTTGHTPGDDYYVVTAYLPGALDLGDIVGIDYSTLPTPRISAEVSAESGNGVMASYRRDPVILAAAKAVDYPAIDALLKLDFMIGLPIYDVPGRRGYEHLAGWITGSVLRFSDVLEDATSRGPADLGLSISVDVRAPGRPGDQTLDRVTARSEGDPDPRPDSRQRRATIEVMGIPVVVDAWSTAPPVDHTGAAIALASGAISTLVAAAYVAQRRRSILRRRAFQDELDSRSQLEHDLVESVRSALVVIDARGDVVMGNAAWDELRGPADTDAYLAQLDPTGDGADGADEQLRLVLSGERAAATFEVHVARGERGRWIKVRATRLGDGRAGAVALHTDVTTERRAREELTRQALRDPLTGLLNRAGLDAALDAALTRARADRTRLALLFLDLDGFKSVNDTHGHAVGDEVLRTTAEVIMQSVRPTDVVARLGGDEFVVVLEDVAAGEAGAVAQRIHDLVSPPDPGPRSVPAVAASIGVAEVDGTEAPDPAELLTRADRAMYRSKWAGGARSTAWDRGSQAVGRPGPPASG
jgi:diguanylate cyclase (GGDEF)-like protein